MTVKLNSAIGLTKGIWNKDYLIADEFIIFFKNWVESKAIYRVEANARSKNGKNENITAAVKQKTQTV